VQTQTSRRWNLYCFQGRSAYAFWFASLLSNDSNLTLTFNETYEAIMEDPHSIGLAFLAATAHLPNLYHCALFKQFIVSSILCFHTSVIDCRRKVEALRSLFFQGNIRGSPTLIRFEYLPLSTEVSLTDSRQFVYSRLSRCKLTLLLFYIKFTNLNLVLCNFVKELTCTRCSFKLLYLPHSVKVSHPSPSFPS